MKSSLPATLSRDLSASVVIFFVALPLCLGVASASGAPLLAGLIGGIVGGIVVGLLSGSHTSVTGPSTGLSSIVVAQIAIAGSFEAFLVAIVLAGAIQIGLGLLRIGAVALFVPSSVIKGLLAAIGILIILKQVPHLVGHDADAEDDMSFLQTDGQNTFSEIQNTLYDLETGAMLIGLASFALLILWNRSRLLKSSPLPAPLAVVILGILGNSLCSLLGEPFAIDVKHMVQVPLDFTAGLQSPRFTGLLNPAIWLAAGTIAIVASLETLLNLEAADKIDPQKRIAPPNRELIAQGCGNMVSGLLGGLPVSSAIVRSSVNINAGGQTRLATILQGVILLLCVALLPGLLNRIPLSCLAAILIVTGWKLASWKIFTSLYQQGWTMFLPFAATVLAILFTDLLQGTLIGLATSTIFILRSNVKNPLRRVLEKHASGDVLAIQLANQVSFLNRATLFTAFEEIPAGGHMLIDARETDYIDPDVLELIRSFESEAAPARNITVSLLGFYKHNRMHDRILYADFTSPAVRDGMTPERVLQILKDGNERFQKGEQLTRSLKRQMAATAMGQAPIAAVLSCIDSRTPTEIVFDLGLGDIFTVRIAGNVPDAKILGSLEFACKVAGAKLILVLGHTRCGAVNAAIDFTARGVTAVDASGCDHLDSLVDEIRHSIDPQNLAEYATWDAAKKESYADTIVKANVQHTMATIRSESRVLRELIEQKQIWLVGAVYDVSTGSISFMD